MWGSVARGIAGDQVSLDCGIPMVTGTVLVLFLFQLGKLKAASLVIPKRRPCERVDGM